MRPFNDLTGKRQASKRWLARLSLPSLDHKGTGNGVEPPDVCCREIQQPVSQLVEKSVKTPPRVD